MPMKVANVDERPRVWQLRLLQEVLDYDWIVTCALTADALDLLHVSATARSTNVLEVHIRVRAGREDRAEKVEHALVGAETLEHVDDFPCADLLVVLNRNLHDDVQVLAVMPHQIGKALERRFRGHAREELDQKLWRHLVRVEHHALEVRGVRVVLERILHEAGLLAQLADVSPIIMREQVHLENRLRDLWCLLEVHRQELRLKLALVGPVRLECVEENRSGLLQAVLLHKCLHDLVYVDQRHAVLALQQALCEVGGALGIYRHHVLEQGRIIGLVAHLLHVCDNLVGLAEFHETLDHLMVDAGAEVYGEGEFRVHRSHDVSQLLRALELVFLQPLLHKLPAPLRHHHAKQLRRLDGIQLTVLKQR
mmetsp:Transcript_7009/g.17529  ORF Transcript_7009/g.17529 Transcript_7009/m.17529 type:complete len:366 (+) Transcript_7009:2899-3996(+)